MSTAVCSHLDTIEFTAVPDPVVGCEECLKIGSTWVHLRMCMECGKIGCCDDSLNRHASTHARGLASDHQVGGARGGLELVLRRRSRVRRRMIALDGNAIAADLLAASSL
jgi:hypothetical protein